MLQGFSFKFSSKSRVHKNEHSAGKSLVCFLVYRDKVRHQTKFCCAWMSDFVSINQETH